MQVRFVVLTRDLAEPELLSVLDILEIDTTNPAHYTSPEIFARFAGDERVADIRVEYPRV